VHVIGPGPVQGERGDSVVCGSLVNVFAVASHGVHPPVHHGPAGFGVKGVNGNRRELHVRALRLPHCAACRNCGDQEGDRECVAPHECYNRSLRLPAPVPIQSMW
jgi:hypothetical protein